ncbi:aspartate aminotransferase-like [Amphiura filiformis]|uniref:aspartate aminotransferase-like n=1 Tax=Amphiura filiformis TaxID=82378 RepID=UPI003B20CD22
MEVETSVNMEVDNSFNTEEGNDKKRETKQLESRSLLMPHLREYCPASNLAFNEHVNKLIAEGKKVYHFAFGQSPFPVLKSAQKSLGEHAWQSAYLPVAGLPELRARICNFHSKLDGLVHLQSDNVVVGPGSKELIFLLLHVFDGDVLILSPSWTTYKPQTLLAGKKAIEVSTKFEDNWKIKPKDLEKIIMENCVSPNRLLIFCNPDNPTGTCYSAEDLEALSVVLRKHNTIVLSDEIYARLHFDNNHISIAKVYPEGTILSSGISKWASAGGWRLGYSIYPSELKELNKAVCSAASHTYSCAPAPVQYAAVRLFCYEEDTMSYVLHCRRILAAVAKYCYKQLTSVGVKAVMPTSGFYIFPDFEILKPAFDRRGIETCTQMCEALFEETNVAVMAGGPAFLRPTHEFTVRLCYINFDGARALVGSEKFGVDEPLTDAFLHEYCLPVVEGIQAIKKWVVDHLEMKKPK